MRLELTDPTTRKSWKWGRAVYLNRSVTAEDYEKAVVENEHDLYMMKRLSFIVTSLLFFAFLIWSSVNPAPFTADTKILGFVLLAGGIVSLIACIGIHLHDRSNSEKSRKKSLGWWNAHRHEFGTVIKKSGDKGFKKAARELQHFAGHAQHMPMSTSEAATAESIIRHGIDILNEWALLVKPVGLPADRAVVPEDPANKRVDEKYLHFKSERERIQEKMVTILDEAQVQMAIHEENEHLVAAWHPELKGHP
ncbi:hypothetical protein [Arthrobacter sp. A2-55]|uniref:hypothetical protein n=1 Tax=Arthrobacter sp. A2-55 TaxID=2897337 RepID=UPI0021CD1D2B|nr:hypothetical protein [Arthrobacter sp. A2-55]